MGKPKTVWIKDYAGFESLSDLSRDIIEAFEFGEQGLSELDPEYDGTITVTMTYSDSEDTPPRKPSVEFFKEGELEPRRGSGLDQL